MLGTCAKVCTLLTSAGFGGTGTPGKVDQPWPHAADGQPEPGDSVRGSGSHADPRGHRGPLDVGPGAARDPAQRVVEARRVARREELLGVGRAAGAAHLGRHGQIKVQPAIRGADVAVAPVAGGQRLGGIEDLHMDSLCPIPPVRESS